MSYIVKDSLAKSFNHSFDATSLELGVSRQNAPNVGVSALSTVIEALHRAKYIELIIGKTYPMGMAPSLQLKRLRC